MVGQSLGFISCQCPMDTEESIRVDSPATGIAYGNEVNRVISEAGAPLAGFITKSLMGCGGQIIPPPQYLETAFQHVRAAGGLCIIDEVQVGFARVGTHFWAFERQNVFPIWS